MENGFSTFSMPMVVGAPCRGKQWFRWVKRTVGYRCVHQIIEIPACDRSALPMLPWNKTSPENIQLSPCCRIPNCPVVTRHVNGLQLVLPKLMMSPSCRYLPSGTGSSLPVQSQTCAIFSRHLPNSSIPSLGFQSELFQHKRVTKYSPDVGVCWANASVSFIGRDKCFESLLFLR